MIPGSATKKERGGNDSTLQEKERIAGRRSKVAVAPADANKSNSGEEIILQEKNASQGLGRRWCSHRPMPTN